MRNLLSLCCFLFTGSCAIISFANDFEDIPDATVAEVKQMPHNKMVLMQGNLDNYIFRDTTGEIKTGNTFTVSPEQKIEILARTNNSLLSSSIDIITISPL